MVGGVHCFREGEGALLDLLVCIFHIFGLKWRSAVDQSVNDDSNAPDIHLIAVPLGLQYLRRDVVWRTADGLLLLPVEVDPRG